MEIKRIEYPAYAPNYILNWGNAEIADEITEEGRKKLREVIKLMDELGYTPLVGYKDENKFSLHF